MFGFAPSAQGSEVGGIPVIEPPRLSMAKILSRTRNVGSPHASFSAVLGRARHIARRWAMGLWGMSRA